MTIKTVLFAAITPLMLTAPAHAQSPTPSTPADGAPAMMELPEACTAGLADTAGMGPGPMHDMPGHRGRMMRGMMETQIPMLRGMMNENPDLAFACSMLAHHQAAVRLAEAQMEFGSDETMRGMAEEAVQARQSEIEQLTSWIETQAGTAAAAGSATPSDAATGESAATDPSAPAEGLGAGKSTATGGVPMEPAADAAGSDGAVPADPSAPGQGEGAGKSTATGGVPMEPAADATPADGAMSTDPSTPAQGEGAGKSTATGGVPMEPAADATPADGSAATDSQSAPASN